jgi:hypothetical protein
MVYKIGNDTFLSNELLTKLNLSCPPGTSECEINVVPVATAAVGSAAVRLHVARLLVIALVRNDAIKCEMHLPVRRVQRQEMMQ